MDHGSFESEARDNSRMNRFTADLAQAINSVRTAPTSFIPHLMDHIARFVDEYSYIDRLGRARTSISTTEGKSAVRECIEFLERVKPVPPVESNVCLENAAVEELCSLTRGGRRMEHPLGKRFSMHGNWRGSIGNAVIFGHQDPVAVVMAALISDGDEERGQRQSIFNPKYLQIGSSIGADPVNLFCCVINYATQMLCWDTLQTEDVIIAYSKTLKGAEFCDEHCFSKVLRSIPVEDIASDVNDMLSERGYFNVFDEI